MCATRKRQNPRPSTGHLPRASRSPGRACRREGTCVRERVCGWAGPVVCVGVGGMGENVRLHFNVSVRAAGAVGARGSLTALLAGSFSSSAVSWLAGGSPSTLLFDSQTSDLKFCWRTGWRMVALPPCATSCAWSSGSRGPARARENVRRVCSNHFSNRASPRAIELVQRRW